MFFLFCIFSIIVLVHSEEDSEVGESTPEAIQDLQTEFWLPYSVTEDVDFTIATLAGSFFYVTTGAHGVHVFVGLVFITYFIYKAHTGGWDPNNAQSIEYYGLYWHFVDLAWVLIFPAFYLY